VRLWRWKSRKPEQPVAPATAAPAPAMPKRPKTGDDLRQAFLEKLEARAEEKQA
jgi:hypothetical protein